MTRRKALQALLSLLIWIEILPSPVRCGSPWDALAAPAAALSGAALETLLAFGEILVLQREVFAIRTFVVPDLLLGYGRSAPGWAIVAYRTFPGRCGNLARYTRPDR